VSRRLYRRVRGVNKDTTGNLRGGPYLSIVIASRNDDHGGNMLRRMQIALSGLLEQLVKYRIKSELILIDWNPPPDKPLLKDAIKWPEGLRYCSIRVIIVPSSIHQRYKYSDKTPMNAVVAANCGIRRARGQFVLPGVIDLLYSDELMSYIASKVLRKDERYRVDRCDVNRNVTQFDTLREQLDYCRKNIIRINAQAPRIIQWALYRGLPNLHTNACGDFQLMSRHYWHLLRGYREADLITAHVDSLLSYASCAAGVREVVLKSPMRIYHIDHDDKFNDKIKRAAPLDGWLSFPFIPAWFSKKMMPLYYGLIGLMGYEIKSSVYGVPTLDSTEYRKMGRDIVAGRRPYIFNDDNWGLGQESLQEFVLSTAEWDKEYERN